MTALAALPEIQRSERDAPFPFWPVAWMIAGYPLWFLLGLSGFMWVAFSMPMLATLIRRRGLVAPKGTGWWIIYLVAVTGSVMSIDSVGRLAGWTLRFGYYIGASVLLLYILNGRTRGIDPWRVVRMLTYLWMAVVAGGYLAFILGDLSFKSPMYYVMPQALLDNELIGTWATPSFADLQDIIGVPVPRPKAPFAYTNGWGSMLAILTPIAFVALYERRVGLSYRLVRFTMFASIVPAVISLNRGLWLSLGLGVLYAAVRLGVAGEARMVIRGLWATVILLVVFTISPLGNIVATRINTGHSNEDRLSLAVDAVEGAVERPVFGWGAPRPNDRNLPSVGTHGQLWFATFSHGFLGAIGFVGAISSLAWHTRKQSSTAGLWAHTVIIVAMVQMPYYLMVPDQLFTVFAAAAVAFGIRAIDQEPAPIGV